MIVRNGNDPCHHDQDCPHSLGPQSPAPLRGFTHRGHEVPSGAFVCAPSALAAARESQRRYLEANREQVNDRKRAARKAAVV